MHPSEWVGKNHIPLSLMEEVWIDGFKRQTKLCEKCGQTDEMLCGGVRPAFDLTSSQEEQRLVTTYEICEKLAQKSVEGEIKNKLKGAYLPMNAALPILLDDDYPVVFTDELGGLYFDGQCLDGVNADKAGIETTRMLFRDIVGTIVSGYTAKYILPQWWYNQPPWEWEEMGFNDTYTTDFVVVERLDANTGSDTARSQMFAMVQSRIAAYLPTVVTLSTRDPKARNETEQEVFEWLQSN